MNKHISQRMTMVLSALLVINVWWLVSALNAVAAKDTADKALLVKDPKTAPLPAKKEQLVKVQSIAPIKPEPPTTKASEQVQTDSVAPKTLSANTKPAQRANKGEPAYVGQMSLNFQQLERFVRQQGGRILLYDLTTGQPVRQISSQVLVAVNRAQLTDLSAVGHIVTDDIEPTLVKSWTNEARQYLPSADLEVVIKLPASVQTQFQHFAESLAVQNDLAFSGIDKVRFAFTDKGLVITDFEVDGSRVVVQQPFNG